MIKSKNRQRAHVASLVLLITGVALEVANIIIVFTLGHPYTSACPAASSIVPTVSYYLGLIALIAAIAAYVVSNFSNKKNYVLPASTLLILLIICLTPILMQQSGFGINWCNYHF